MANPTEEGLMVGVAALEEFFAPAAAATPPPQLLKSPPPVPEGRKNGCRPRPVERGWRECELPPPESDAARRRRQKELGELKKWANGHSR